MACTVKSHKWGPRRLERTHTLLLHCGGRDKVSSKEERDSAENIVSSKEAREISKKSCFFTLQSA